MKPSSYETDNRFAKQGWAPEGALAAYSARWIDMKTWGDIVPDRQGMAYNETLDRDVLSGMMNDAEFWKDLPQFEKATIETHGEEFSGRLCETMAGKSVDFKMWRPDPDTKGYIYVEAWLNATY